MHVMFVTLDTSQFEMPWLKAYAFWNINLMFVTLNTFHFEMSLSNDFAE